MYFLQIYKVPNTPCNSCNVAQHYAYAIGLHYTSDRRGTC